VSASPEFASEVREIIDLFSDQLLEIEGQLRDGDDYDPDLLNGAFRSIHTLQGLSALGVNEIVDLSHRLENTLDTLRLGQASLNQRALDLLFESAELFQNLLANVGEVDHGRVDRVMSGLAGLVDAAADPLPRLDNAILGVLTEYEAHRLCENVRLGRHIFRVHAGFALLAIDRGIDAIKRKLERLGEVITFLPSADITGEDRIIQLDILVGSKSTLAEIAEGVDDEGVVIDEPEEFLAAIRAAIAHREEGT
jgi:two-component system chemotaxis sensor kinase CheA